MALQDKPNAILLDLRMPNFSGYELCRTFKSMTFHAIDSHHHHKWRGRRNHESIVQGAWSGSRFFEKPVDFDALRATLTKDCTPPARPKTRSASSSAGHV